METLLFFEEVSAAVQQLKCGRAPGVDGLPVEFYQRFWTVMGKDSGRHKSRPFSVTQKKGEAGDLSHFSALTTKYSPKNVQTDSSVVWRRSYRYESFIFTL